MSGFPSWIALLCLLPAWAQAWGDEGHEVVALIAYHYLEPAVRAKVDALLAADSSQLTRSTDIASEATWADRYRTHHLQTAPWHYIDLELPGPDLAGACAADDCIVAKIGQFERELAAPATPPAERLMALQFLLHLVGDLHQPLHASDAADRGGNQKAVRAEGHAAGNLHHYWDTVFVARLGPNAAAIAPELVRDIGWWQRWRWRRGSIETWALESFAIGAHLAYGGLPQPSGGQYDLDASYVAVATAAVRRQLQRAGVRLAVVLNRDLR